MCAEDTPIYWLMQSAADLPDADDWLSDGERAFLLQLRTSKRRNDWRLGRWTAKCLLVSHLAQAGREIALPAVEILARPDGAPAALVAGEILPVSLSLSHSHGLGLCAVGASDVMLGCDLEFVEPRSLEFVEDYFTREEAAWVRRLPPSDQPLFATLIWSGKESALKALREGLRRDTRSVEVVPGGPEGEGDWYRLEVRCAGSPSEFCGWWRRRSDHILTIVSAQAQNAWPMLKKKAPRRSPVSRSSFNP